VEKVLKFYKNYLSYNIPDTTSATLIALGITPKKYKRLKYRVVENDSNEKSLVAYSFNRAKVWCKKPYGFIGTFNRPGQLLWLKL